jgi:hypothetical protein
MCHPRSLLHRSAVWRERSPLVNKKALTTVNQSFNMHHLFDNGFQFQLAVPRKTTGDHSPLFAGTVHKNVEVHPLRIERREVM